MTKPKRHLDLRGKRERADEARAANAREKAIAESYFNASPSISNLARAVYHWYNSVPMLGGQNESGLDLQTGEAPTPGMRNPKNIVNTISKLNKAFDRHYFTALATGDLKGASNLREAHFRVYAPKSKIKSKVYHGTKNKFNSFDESRINTTDAGTFGRGIYTTPKKTYAQLYGDNIMPLYVNIKNPKDYRNAPMGDIIAEKLAFGDYFGTGIGIDGVLGRPNWKGFKGVEEIIIHDPKNVKSAKTVVRDNSNSIIPLSQRDNFNINDIRFKDGGSIHIAKQNMTKPRRRLEVRGSYDDWANALAALWNINRRELANHDYNYEAYYQANPSEAYAQLNRIRTNNPNAHFPDTYKLPTHPTFSTDSKYSGRDGNVVGGTWVENPSALQRWTYQLSPSQVRNNWNIRRTLEYAGDAEDEGFRVTDNQGRYPIINGIVEGGVLPSVTIRPKHKDGGIYIKPSKRGTFTAAATKHGMSVQEFAARVLRNKEDYSPSLVKKANFARNASKWH